MLSQVFKGETEFTEKDVKALSHDAGMHTIFKREKVMQLEVKIGIDKARSEMVLEPTHQEWIADTATFIEESLSEM